jgi:hypothetical protein
LLRSLSLNASSHADTARPQKEECTRTTPVAGGRLVPFLNDLGTYISSFFPAKGRSSGSGEGESGQEREKAEKAAKRLSRDQMDSAERRASSRTHKVVKRFVEEEEVQGNARKKAKQGAHEPCGAGQGAKGEVVDVGRLSLEQAAAKLVGIVTIRKFFPRYGFFNGLITGFDATTKKFQVKAFGVDFPTVKGLLFAVHLFHCFANAEIDLNRAVWCGVLCLK